MLCQCFETFANVYPVVQKYNLLQQQPSHKAGAVNHPYLFTHARLLSYSGRTWYIFLLIINAFIREVVVLSNESQKILIITQLNIFTCP